MLIEVEKSRLRNTYKINVFSSDAQIRLSGTFTGSGEDAWYKAYFWMYHLIYEEECELGEAALIVDDDDTILYLKYPAPQILGDIAGEDVKEYFEDESGSFWSRLRSEGSAKANLNLLSGHGQVVITRTVRGKLIELPPRSGLGLIHCDGRNSRVDRR